MPQPFRPLSPHLFIYKPEITMVMSIMHRITGMGLYVGTLLLTWWLVAAVMGGEALETVHWVMASWLGQLVLFGFTWALFHHLLGGLRHFFWDMGAGFSENVRFGFAWGTAIGGLTLTALLWIFVVWS